MGKKVSLKDIANKVGVSIALVSYVMSGRAKEARVGEAMAKKILKIAKDLNYQPNLVARNLKTGKTQTIGLVVADISNPFFSSMARIIEDEAAKYGYVLLFGSSDENSVKSARVIDVLVNRQVDALIIAMAEDTENQLRQLQRQRIPFVLIDRCPDGFKADSVCIDNEAAAIAATQHLVAKGCKKIAMLAYDSGLPHMQARTEGYRKALRRSGIKGGAVKKIRFEHLQKDLEKAIRELTKAGFDGIFFATNTLAIDGLKVIKEMKQMDTLAIAAFDGSDVFDMLDNPPAFVQQPLAEIGKMALGLVMARINHPNKKQENIIFQAQLIAR